ATGLLALLLLTDARRPARTSPEGTLVLLEDQDRGRWSRAQIAEGLPLAAAALAAPSPGPYALQAGVAAEHAPAAAAAETSWPRIVRLYDELLAVQPSPVVAFNRAVAVAMADGPRAGLALVDELRHAPELREYHLLPATRADLLRRLGAFAEA